MKKNRLGFLLPLALTAPALAQPAVGYWHDTSGAVVRNSTGDCWRTGYWMPEQAVAECEPALAKKPEPPKVVAAPPQPTAQPEPPPPTEALPAVATPVATVAAAPAVLRVKAAPRKIALESSASFSLGKADLSEVGRRSIDRDVLNHLNEFAAVEGITIVGHSDPLGSEARNRRLSKDRAEAVKTYLISKGVPPDMIKTDGVGSSQPAPSVKCNPGLAPAKLAECLAPHRRIEIDVAGQAK
jgi:OmpA-OmpF porin, OOP family